MMAGRSNDKCSCSEVCSDDPPPLSITLKKARDLPNETKHWSEVDRPVDILLLTVEDCELLACYHYLKYSFSSYEKSIGYVYFGKMSEDKDGSLKVALMRCSKQSLHPGGSQTTTKNAVTLLKPKATFLVGFCYSLNPDKAQLGDVVISSKLTTDFHKTPVSSYIGNLVRSAPYGWKAPLEYPETREVNVCDGEILSCSDLIDAEQQCQSYPGAIAAEIEGLFAAAHEMKMEWLVVKGVCGFVHGVASTNDSWKTFACVMAASVVSHMLRNSLVFEDWPHYRGNELDIKVEVDNMKLEEQNTQTGMLATESDRYQEVQQPRASAPSAASESVSCPQTEDLKACKEEIFLSIVRNYLQTTSPQSSEEHNKFKEHLKEMRLIITGVSFGSLLITVKCESLMILEKLWTDYSSGHLGKVVQNCFVTEKVLKELNLAELRLKTTMDIEEYNACKMLFEKDALRGALSSEFHSTSSTSESPQIKEQWGKREQKTTIMERAKLGGTSSLTVVPTTGHGRELEESRGRTDTVPLLVSPTSDPEEELGELRMELLRMKDISAGEESCKSDDPSENKRRRLAGGSPKHFRRSKVKHRDEESSPSDALTPKKRRTRLAGCSTKHLRPPKVEGCNEESSPSDVLTPKKKKTRLAGSSTKHFRRSKVKRRYEESPPSNALTPKRKKTRLAGGSTKYFRWPKVKRRDEESSPSDALTPKKRKTRLAGGSTKHSRRSKVKRRDEEWSSSDASTPKKRVKQGVPSDEDLEWLSQKLEIWKTVGRRLEIDEARLTAFDDENRGCSEKIYKMLLHWKERNGSTATYTILHDALCHPLVKRTDLAEQLMTDISTGEEGCKSGDSSENKRRRLAGPLNVEKCQEKLKSYYDTLCKVKNVPWDESSSIEINEIYTPLNWMRDHRKPSGVTQEELEDYTDMFEGKHTRMLVYGRPGIGKSTFCKKAAYDWSKASKEILMNFSIVLLINLRDVCDVGNIRDVLLASKLLASDGPISVDSLYDYVINNQDKVLLILDGYDEYSFARKHSPILAIWKGEQLRDCHVIVTTRQLKCDELRGPSHVQLEIQGFKTWERKDTFARKFMEGEEDLEEFNLYLEKKDLDDMAEIPLVLLMLCILWKEKRHKGLPKSRADIFTQFIQTMLDHKVESQQLMPFQKVTSTEAREDLSNLGKVAFEALLQDRLYVRQRELPGNISSSFEKLRDVGLFQIVNLTSLNPEKGAYFIHKSVQEFLAAWHIKEEVSSIKGESTPSLSKVESFEEILKMNEVLKFACELSTEAAYAVFRHVASVGRKESFPECDFIDPLQASQILKRYRGLISHSYFCCSAEKRRDLCSVFSSHTGGVLSLDCNKLNITANEHLLKSGMTPNVIVFPLIEHSSEESYQNLITVAEDTDAVFISCSGEKKAADLLKKFPRRPVMEFFLKRERKMIVYVRLLWKEEGVGTFPTEMLRELISPTVESTRVKRVGDPLNEQDNEIAPCLTQNTFSITDLTPQSLSREIEIFIYNIEKQEMKMLADFLPLFTALQGIEITGNPFEIIDAQLTETLVSRIIFTDRLETLELVNINLTAKPTAAIIRSLHQAPSLGLLDLSKNPLGEGVSVLTHHLSCVPHLERLCLFDVKMTKQQVNELSAAVRQSNISWLETEYHDRKGNVKPEEEWPTDEYWRNCMDTDSGDEEEPESYLEM